VTPFLSTLTGEHPNEHIIRSFVIVKEILFDDVLPSFLLHLPLEKDKEVTIVILVSQVMLELLRITHVLDNPLFQFDWRSLVRLVTVILFFDNRRRRSKCIDGQKVMSYMILVGARQSAPCSRRKTVIEIVASYVKHVLVEKDVMLLMVLLQQL